MLTHRRSSLSDDSCLALRVHEGRGVSLVGVRQHDMRVGMKGEPQSAAEG